MREMPFKHEVLKIAVVVGLMAPALASCGGSGSNAPAIMPNAIHQVLPAQQAAMVRTAPADMSTVKAFFETTETNAAQTCNVFPLVCVDQGGSATIGIKVTCTRNGHVINCGSVHWKVHTNHVGLTASFKPNPGNPSHDTVRAAATVPAGTRYTQTITTTCSAIAGPCAHGTLPIHVTP